MKHVAFLCDKSGGLSPEERSAWEFLSRSKSIKPIRVAFQSLNRTSGITNLPPVLWWHYESSTSLPQVCLDPNVISSLRRFVKDGGSLLLSLLASQYVVDLGLEESRPNVMFKGSWNEKSWAKEYPDIRGFAPYRGHPLFDGLPGGVYTWNPATGANYSADYYDDAEPMNGRTIAVERLYIKLNEKRRLIAEFEYGKGTVLTVGSYFYFDERNHRFRKNLETFAANCFDYLIASRVSERKRTYWDFDQAIVQKVDHASKPFEVPAQVLHFRSKNQKIVREISRSTHQEQSFDLGGKRILIAGKESGGIEEVWSHPGRILHNLKVAFKIGDNERRWSHDLKPRISIYPECLVRVYHLHGAEIEELVFSDRERSCGAIQYRIISHDQVEIIITAATDLRLMWPLSMEGTGSLSYSWDEHRRALVVSAPHANFFSIFGSSLSPTEFNVGQFSAIDITGDQFIGKPGSDIVVTSAFRYRLPKSQSCLTVGFAGSVHTEDDAERSFRAVVHNPTASLDKHSRYYQQLSERCIQIKSSDDEFNEAFPWAVISTDRCYSETDGLGRALFAGHGTTARGWNGGHTISGRPGYAWYFARDGVWASFALLDYGEFDKVRDVLEFLGRYQDPAGKILHEMTTSGFAHYDAADSTPLYVILMGKYLRASGDVAFVRGQFEQVNKAMEFCFSTDADRDHLIENSNVGHGWVEGGHLLPVHCEHYLASCWAQALEEAAGIATVLRKPTLAKRWGAESRKVRKIVAVDFWNTGVQFYSFGKLPDGGFSAQKTLLPAVGMFFGCTDDQKGRQCLEEYASENFSTDWGVRIVGKNNPMYNPSGYHYGSVWPLFTGWASLAEFKLNMPVQAFIHAMNNIMLFKQFSAGNFEEVLNGERFQPAGVCAHQAWSASMAIQPVIEGMLGFQCDAITSRIDLRPYFPPHWKWFHVRRLRIGKQLLDVRMTRDSTTTRYEFALTGGKSLQVRLQPYLLLGAEIIGIGIGTKRKQMRSTAVRSYADSPLVEFILSGKNVVTISHRGGIGLIPPVPHPLPNQESRGLRIIREEWTDRGYTLTLEGRAGIHYDLEIVDPESSVKSVDGARIKSRSGEQLVLAVDFDPSKDNTSYSRRTVTINV